MSGAPRWVRPQGDTGPGLDYTCRAEPAAGQRVGLPMNLATATSIVGTVRRWSDGAIVQSAAATIVGSPANGSVRLPLTTMISTVPGLHGVTFVVVDGGEQRTYPGPLDPAWLMIAAPLGADVTTAPAAPGAPVFIADGATGAVAANGQMVFAGASSTITVPTNISWFQVGQTGTPWATGTTPTIVQAGSTVAAGVPSALLAAGGNLAVLTLAAGVWQATTTGRATIWAYNGSSYAPDPDARLIERATGDPAPTGVVDNDIVLEQT